MPDLALFRPLDAHFARFVERAAGASDPGLVLAAALASRAVGEGHICLDLRRVAGKTLPQALEVLQLGAASEPDATGPLPPLDAWLDLLRSLAAARVVASDDRPGRKPLVLDGAGRLYLQRYFAYEATLADLLLARAAPDPAWDDRARALAGRRLPELFPAPSAEGVDWQRFAAFLALRRNLTVISGGPGTGKTTTVARVLALLIERQDRPPRIRLAAPTGKAAARLADTVKLAKRNTLACAPAVMDSIPEAASTLHRLLGYRPHSPYFRHDRTAPLDADVVVVDEASMVPLPLMAKLLDALRPEAKLILLGDMDQLASVEPGYVLGDICAAGAIGRLSPGVSAEYAALTGVTVPSSPLASRLSDCLVALTRSYRFPPGGAIDQASRAINLAETPADAAAAVATLHAVAARAPDLVTCWRRDRPDGLPPGTDDVLLEGFGPYVAAATPAEALDALDRFRVLCALRRGPNGVARLNRHVEELFGLDPADPCYRHRPVLVTENDYGLGLFNGDVGVLLDAGPRRRAFFRDAEGLRSYPPHMLPTHETCFAMTVHKAQGSEFDRVLVVLPERDTPVVTKELVYTALTRARRWAGLVVDDEALAAALVRRCRSESGLRERLGTPQG